VLRLLADENFNGIVFRELLLREPALDLVRAQDLRLVGRPDPVVLDWAAAQGRVLLTHDKKPIP
jgi:predicted nuclease of predicted toxin-antitoxin system